jgi:hypothetical protein
VTLLAEVVARLNLAVSPHATIGAIAMAVLGARRSTQDFDILTTDRAIFINEF